MNRVKYLDGKYMSWEETMEDFHESLKVKKAEEAYKQHLSNLQNGFPDKQKLPPPPPSPQEPTYLQLNNIPAQQTNPTPPRYSYTYNQYNPQENNFNFNQQPENYNFNQQADNFPSFKPTGFNDNFGLNNAQNFGFKQSDKFGFNSDSFSFKPSENFGFNANDSFHNSSFNNQFSNFNQFNNSYNNPYSQKSSFGSSVSFTPKASFNYSASRFPTQFNRLENDIIFEENQNNAAIRY